MEEKCLEESISPLQKHLVHLLEENLAIFIARIVNEPQGNGCKSIAKFSSQVIETLGTDRNYTGTIASDQSGSTTKSLKNKRRKKWQMRSK